MGVSFFVRKAPTQVLLDDFTGTNFSDPDPSKWTRTSGIAYESNNGQGSYIYENALRQRTQHLSTNTQEMTYNDPIVGNFSLTVDWDMSTAIGTDWWSQKFITEATNGNICYIGRLYRNGVSGHGLRFAYYNGSTWTFQYIDPYSISVGQYTITRDGSTVTLYYPGGSFEVPIALEGNVTVRLAIQSDSFSSTTVDWDNLTLTQ